MNSLFKEKWWLASDESLCIYQACGDDFVNKVKLYLRHSMYNIITL